MNKKAQGLLEFMLLIGSAIFIAAILLAIFGWDGTGEYVNRVDDLNSFCLSNGFDTFTIKGSFERGNCFKSWVDDNNYFTSSRETIFYNNSWLFVGDLY